MFPYPPCGRDAAKPNRHRAVRVALAALGLLSLAHSIDGIAANATSVSVLAVILSKSNCKFSSTTGSVLAFGTIDPSSTVNATATALPTFTCNGSAPTATFFISSDDGLHSVSSGNPRMQHAVTATEFLPYSVTLTPASASVPKGSTQTLTLTGAVTPSSFNSAIAGTYTDTLVLTITP